MKYLNHSKAELRKFTKAKLVSIGHGILKKLPKSTLVNTVFNLEQLAKSKGIRSVGKIARKAGRKARSGARRAKTGITSRRRKIDRKRNGRTIQKSKRRSMQQVKGSPQAKAWGKKMARIRSRSR